MRVNEALNQYFFYITSSCKVSDIVKLPSFNSELEPGQIHYFGFIMDLQEEFPNLAVITAEECEPEGPPGQAANPNAPQPPKP